MTVLDADDARALVDGLAAVTRRLGALEHRAALVLGELGRLRSEVRAAREETAEAHGVAIRAAVDAGNAGDAAEIAEVLADDSRRLDARLAAVERGAVRASSSRAAAIAGGILAAVEVWRAMGR